MTTTHDQSRVDLSPPAQRAEASTSGAPAIADPGPLGLAGFAMTTFVLSVFNAHLIHTAQLVAVFLPLALFYGGIVQLFAGMWEFRKNNTFGALAFSSYAAFWLSLAAYVRFVAPGLPVAQTHQATGLFLLAWAIFTAYMVLASLKTTWMLAATFVMLFVTFVLLAWGDLGESTSVTKAGGWTGLITAALAWYISAAGVTNSTWGRTALPVFPVKK
jgi:hypothetical protein